MKKLVTMAVGCGLLAGAALFAGPNMDFKPYEGSAQFQKLKKLSGKWEGTSKMGKEDQKVTVEYHITSGGSALVETLFPGTPQEMVSVYRDKGGKLAMTHYCMLHNQPEMELKSANDKEVVLELAKSSGIKPSEQHMHSLAITFTDDDHITQNWGCMDPGGKPGESKIMSFSRVK